MDTLCFRTFEEEDWEKIYEWKNDDNQNNYNIGLNRRISKEEAKKWVIDRINYKPYEIWWAICTKKNNEIIGYVSLTNIHFINRSAHFSGIRIGDKNYQDGLAWIETYLFVLDYTFNKLNLNRLYGSKLKDHPHTNIISKAFFFNIEGIKKDAVYKNGKYHDLIDSALLAKDYFDHKDQGDYEVKKIIKRIINIKKHNKDK